MGADASKAEKDQIEWRSYILPQHWYLPTTLYGVMT